MKNLSRVICFVVGCLIAFSAFGDTCSKNFTGVFTAYQATKLCTAFGVGQLVLSNGSYLKSRNAAGTADLSLLRADSSDNTELNAATGKDIELTINGTAALTVNDDSTISTASSIKLGGSAPAIVGGSTSTQFNNNANAVALWKLLDAGTFQVPDPWVTQISADANRVFTFSAASDTAHTFTYGDAGTTAAQTFTLSASTADGDDDSITRVAGGGAVGDARGGWARFIGNEAASNGGSIDLNAGNAASANINLALENASSSVIIKDTTSGSLVTISDAGAITTVGTFTSSATSDLGWSVRTGANTACNTTCTSACVVGQDSGTSNIFVGCADATADVCLCAGAS